MAQDGNDELSKENELSEDTSQKVSAESISAESSQNANTLESKSEINTSDRTQKENIFVTQAQSKELLVHEAQSLLGLKYQTKDSSNDKKTELKIAEHKDSEIRQTTPPKILSETSLDIKARLIHSELNNKTIKQADPKIIESLFATLDKESRNKLSERYQILFQQENKKNENKLESDLAKTFGKNSPEYYHLHTYLNKQDSQDKTADAVGTIMTAIAYINKASTRWLDKSTEKMQGESMLRQVISLRSADELKALELRLQKEHPKYFPQGQSLFESLTKIPDISNKTKSVLAIYLNGDSTQNTKTSNSNNIFGIEKRSSKQLVQIAELAVKAGDLQLLDEALRSYKNTSSDNKSSLGTKARAEFAKKLASDKDLQNSFSQLFKGVDLKRAQDIIERGSVSLFTLAESDINKVLGSIRNNFDDLKEQFTRAYGSQESLDYAAGQRLHLKISKGELNSQTLSQQEKNELAQYQKLHGFLVKSLRGSEVAQLEDLLLNGKSTVISEMAKANRANLGEDTLFGLGLGRHGLATGGHTAKEIMDPASKISQEEIVEKLSDKSKAAVFIEQIEASLSLYADKGESKRIVEMLKLKAKVAQEAKSANKSPEEIFEASKKIAYSAYDSLSANKSNGWFKSFTGKYYDPEGVLRGLSQINAQDILRYRNGEKEVIDKAINGMPQEWQRKMAQDLLRRALDTGKTPELTITERVMLASLTGDTAAEKVKNIEDIFKSAYANKDSPEAKELKEIFSAKTTKNNLSENQKLAQKAIEDAIWSATGTGSALKYKLGFGSNRYSDALKSLFENGSISIDSKLSFNYAHKDVYQDLLQASESEFRAQTKNGGLLSSDEIKILEKARQEVQTKDKKELSLAQQLALFETGESGWKYNDFKDKLAKASYAERQQTKEEFVKLTGKDLEQTFLAQVPAREKINYKNLLASTNNSDAEQDYFSQLKASYDQESHWSIINPLSWVRPAASAMGISDATKISMQASASTYAAALQDFKHLKQELPENIREHLNSSFSGAINEFEKSQDYTYDVLKDTGKTALNLGLLIGGTMVAGLLAPETGGGSAVAWAAYVSAMFAVNASVAAAQNIGGEIYSRGFWRGINHALIHLEEPVKEAVIMGGISVGTMGLIKGNIAQWNMKTAYGSFLDKADRSIIAGATNLEAKAAVQEARASLRNSFNRGGKVDEKAFSEVLPIIERVAGKESAAFIQQEAQFLAQKQFDLQSGFVRTLLSNRLQHDTASALMKAGLVKEESAANIAKMLPSILKTGGKFEESQLKQVIALAEKEGISEAKFRTALKEAEQKLVSSGLSKIDSFMHSTIYPYYNNFAMGAIISVGQEYAMLPENGHLEWSHILTEALKGGIIGHWIGQSIPVAIRAYQNGRLAVQNLHLRNDGYYLSHPDGPVIFKSSDGTISSVKELGNGKFEHTIEHPNQKKEKFISEHAYKYKTGDQVLSSPKMVADPNFIPPTRTEQIQSLLQKIARGEIKPEDAKQMSELLGSDRSNPKGTTSESRVTNPKINTTETRSQEFVLNLEGNRINILEQLAQPGFRVQSRNGRLVHELGPVRADGTRESTLIIEQGNTFKDIKRYIGEKIASAGTSREPVATRYPLEKDARGNYVIQDTRPISKLQKDEAIRNGDTLTIYSGSNTQSTEILKLIPKILANKELAPYIVETRLVNPNSVTQTNSIAQNYPHHKAEVEITLKANLNEKEKANAQAQLNRLLAEARISAKDYSGKNLHSPPDEIIGAYKTKEKSSSNLVGLHTNVHETVFLNSPINSSTKSATSPSLKGSSAERVHGIILGKQADLGINQAIEKYAKTSSRPLSQAQKVAHIEEQLGIKHGTLVQHHDGRWTIKLEPSQFNPLTDTSQFVQVSPGQFIPRGLKGSPEAVSGGLDALYALRIVHRMFGDSKLVTSGHKQTSYSNNFNLSKASRSGKISSSDGLIIQDGRTRIEIAKQSNNSSLVLDIKGKKLTLLPQGSLEKGSAFILREGKLIETSQTTILRKGDIIVLKVPHNTEHPNGYVAYTPEINLSQSSLVFASTSQANNAISQVQQYLSKTQGQKEANTDTQATSASSASSSSANSSSSQPNTAKPSISNSKANSNSSQAANSSSRSTAPAPATTTSSPTAVSRSEDSTRSASATNNTRERTSNKPENKTERAPENKPEKSQTHDPGNEQIPFGVTRARETNKESELLDFRPESSQKRFKSTDGKFVVGEGSLFNYVEISNLFDRILPQIISSKEFRQAKSTEEAAKILERRFNQEFVDKANEIVKQKILPNIEIRLVDVRYTNGRPDYLASYTSGAKAINLAPDIVAALMRSRKSESLDFINDIFKHEYVHAEQDIVVLQYLRAQLFPNKQASDNKSITKQEIDKIQTAYADAYGQPLTERVAREILAGPLLKLSEQALKRAELLTRGRKVDHLTIDLRRARSEVENLSDSGIKLILAMQKNNDLALRMLGGAYPQILKEFQYMAQEKTVGEQKAREFLIKQIKMHESKLNYYSQYVEIEAFTLMNPTDITPPLEANIAVRGFGPSAGIEKIIRDQAQREGKEIQETKFDWQNLIESGSPYRNSKNYEANSVEHLYENHKSIATRKEQELASQISKTIPENISRDTYLELISQPEKFDAWLNPKPENIKSKTLEDGFDRSTAEKRFKGEAAEELPGQDSILNLTLISRHSDKVIDEIINSQEFRDACKEYIAAKAEMNANKPTEQDGFIVEQNDKYEESAIKAAEAKEKVLQIVEAEFNSKFVRYLNNQIFKQELLPEISLHADDLSIYQAAGAYTPGQRKIEIEETILQRFIENPNPEIIKATKEIFKHEYVHSEQDQLLARFLAAKLPQIPKGKEATAQQIETLRQAFLEEVGYPLNTAIAKDVLKHQTQLEQFEIRRAELLLKGMDTRHLSADLGEALKILSYPESVESRQLILALHLNNELASRLLGAQYNDVLRLYELMLNSNEPLAQNYAHEFLQTQISQHRNVLDYYSRYNELESFTLESHTDQLFETGKLPEQASLANAHHLNTPNATEIRELIAERLYNGYTGNVVPIYTIAPENFQARKFDPKTAYENKEQQSKTLEQNLVAIINKTLPREFTPDSLVDLFANDKKALDTWKDKLTKGKLVEKPGIDPKHETIDLVQASAILDYKRSSDISHQFFQTERTATQLILALHLDKNLATRLLGDKSQSILEEYRHKLAFTSHAEQETARIYLAEQIRNEEIRLRSKRSSLQGSEPTSNVDNNSNTTLKKLQDLSEKIDSLIPHELIDSNSMFLLTDKAEFANWKTKLEKKRMLIEEQRKGNDVSYLIADHAEAIHKLDRRESQEASRLILALHLDRELSKRLLGSQHEEILAEYNKIKSQDQNDFSNAARFIRDQIQAHAEALEFASIFDTSVESTPKRREKHADVPFLDSPNYAPKNTEAGKSDNGPNANFKDSNWYEQHGSKEATSIHLRKWLAQKVDNSVPKHFGQEELNRVASLSFRPTSLREISTQSQLFSASHEISDPLINGFLFKTGDPNNLQERFAKDRLSTIFDLNRDRVLQEKLTEFEGTSQIKDLISSLSSILNLGRIPISNRKVNSIESQEAIAKLQKLFEESSQFAYEAMTPKAWSVHELEAAYALKSLGYKEAELDLGYFIQKAKENEGGGSSSQKAIMLKATLDRQIEQLFNINNSPIKVRLVQGFHGDISSIQGLSSAPRNNHMWVEVDIKTNEGQKTFIIDPTIAKNSVFERTFTTNMYLQGQIPKIPRSETATNSEQGLFYHRAADLAKILPETNPEIFYPGEIVYHNNLLHRVNSVSPDGYVELIPSINEYRMSEGNNHTQIREFNKMGPNDPVLEGQFYFVEPKTAKDGEIDTRQKMKLMGVVIGKGDLIFADPRNEIIQPIKVPVSELIERNPFGEMLGPRANIQSQPRLEPSEPILTQSRKIESRAVEKDSGTTIETNNSYPKTFKELQDRLYDKSAERLSFNNGDLNISFYIRDLRAHGMQDMSSMAQITEALNNYLKANPGKYTDRLGTNLSARLGQDNQIEIVTNNGKEERVLNLQLSRVSNSNLRLIELERHKQEHNDNIISECFRFVEAYADGTVSGRNPRDMDANIQSLFGHMRKQGLNVHKNPAVEEGLKQALAQYGLTDLQITKDGNDFLKIISKSGKKFESIFKEQEESLKIVDAEVSKLVKVLEQGDSQRLFEYISPGGALSSLLYKISARGADTNNDKIVQALEKALAANNLSYSYAIRANAKEIYLYRVEDSANEHIKQATISNGAHDTNFNQIDTTAFQREIRFNKIRTVENPANHPRQIRDGQIGSDSVFNDRSISAKFDEIVKLAFATPGWQKMSPSDKLSFLEGEINNFAKEYNAEVGAEILPQIRMQEQAGDPTANGTYISFKGIITIGERRLAGTLKELTETLKHEYVHAEQDSLILRRIASTLKEELASSDPQITLEKVMDKIITEYKARLKREGEEELAEADKVKLKALSEAITTEMEKRGVKADSRSIEEHVFGPTKAENKEEIVNWVRQILSPHWDKANNFALTEKDIKRADALIDSNKKSIYKFSEHVSISEFLKIDPIKLAEHGSSFAELPWTAENVLKIMDHLTRSPEMSYTYFGPDHVEVVSKIIQSITNDNLRKAQRDFQMAASLRFTELQNDYERNVPEIETFRLQKVQNYPKQSNTSTPTSLEISTRYAQGIRLKDLDLATETLLEVMPGAGIIKPGIGNKFNETEVAKEFRDKLNDAFKTWDYQTIPTPTELANRIISLQKVLDSISEKFGLANSPRIGLKREINKFGDYQLDTNILFLAENLITKQSPTTILRVLQSEYIRYLQVHDVINHLVDKHGATNIAKIKAESEAILGHNVSDEIFKAAIDRSKTLDPAEKERAEKLAESLSQKNAELKKLETAYKFIEEFYGGKKDIQDIKQSLASSQDLARLILGENANEILAQLERDLATGTNPNKTYLGLIEKIESHIKSQQKKFKEFEFALFHEEEIRALVLASLDTQKAVEMLRTDMTDYLRTKEDQLAQTRDSTVQNIERITVEQINSFKRMLNSLGISKAESDKMISEELTNFAKLAEIYARINTTLIESSKGAAIKAEPFSNFEKRFKNPDGSKIPGHDSPMHVTQISELFDTALTAALKSPQFKNASSAIEAAEYLRTQLNEHFIKAGNKILEGNYLPELSLLGIIDRNGHFLDKFGNKFLEDTVVEPSYIAAALQGSHDIFINESIITEMMKSTSSKALERFLEIVKHEYTHTEQGILELHYLSNKLSETRKKASEKELDPKDEKDLELFVDYVKNNSELLISRDTATKILSNPRYLTPAEIKRVELFHTKLVISDFTADLAMARMILDTPASPEAKNLIATIEFDQVIAHRLLGKNWPDLIGEYHRLSNSPQFGESVAAKFLQQCITYREMVLQYNLNYREIEAFTLMSKEGKGRSDFTDMILSGDVPDPNIKDVLEIMLSNDGIRVALPEKDKPESILSKEASLTEDTFRPINISYEYIYQSRERIRDILTERLNSALNRSKSLELAQRDSSNRTKETHEKQSLEEIFKSQVERLKDKPDNSPKVLRVQELAKKLKSLPNAYDFKQLLGNNRLGLLPKEFENTGITESQIFASLGNLAKALRLLDSAILAGKSPNIAAGDQNFPPFIIQIGNSKVIVSKAGTGETAQVYKLEIGDKSYAFKVARDPATMDIHGPYAELAAFTYLSKHNISDLVHLYAGDPSPESGWIMTDFISAKNKTEKKAGRLLQDVLADEKLILFDDRPANRGPNNMVWDLGGIEPINVKQPETLSEFKELISTENGRRMAGRLAEGIKDAKELREALLLTLELQESNGQVARTAAKSQILSKSDLAEIISQALDLPEISQRPAGSAGRAAFELHNLAGTEHFTELFIKGLRNPESRLETARQLEHLPEELRAQFFYTTFRDYPESRSILARTISSLPSHAQREAMQLAMTDRASRIVLLNEQGRIEQANSALREFLESYNLQNPLFPDNKAHTREDVNAAIDLRLKERRFLTRESQEKTTDRDPIEDWEARKEILADTIAKRFRGVNLSASEYWEYLNHFSSADRKVAERILELAANQASDHALIQSMKDIHEQIQSIQDALGAHKSYDLYTLDTSSPGNMNAYLYRKSNNKDAGIYTLESILDNINSGRAGNPIILFDNIANATDAQKAILARAKEQRDIIIVDLNPRLPNTVDFALGPEKVKEKLNSLIIGIKFRQRLASALPGKHESKSIDELIQEVLKEPLNRSIAEITELSGSQSHKIHIVRPNEVTPEKALQPNITSKQVLSLLEALIPKERINERIMLAELLAENAEIHSIDSMLKELKTLHEMIAESTKARGQNPEDQLYVIGVSDHTFSRYYNAARPEKLAGTEKASSASEAYMTYLYALANGINKDQIITLDLLRQLNSQYDLSSNRVVVIDDAIYSGQQALLDVMGNKLAAIPDTVFATLSAYNGFAQSLGEGNLLSASEAQKKEFINLRTQMSWNEKFNPALYRSNSVESETLKALLAGYSWGHVTSLQGFAHGWPDNTPITILDFIRVLNNPAELQKILDKQKQIDEPEIINI